jgi:hypothetical protein
MATFEADALFPDEHDLGVDSARDRNSNAPRTPPPIQVISLNQEDAAAFAEEIALDQIEINIPRVGYAPRHRDAVRTGLFPRAIASLAVIALLVGLSVAAVAGLRRIAQEPAAPPKDGDIVFPAVGQAAPAETNRPEPPPFVEPPPVATPTAGAEPPPEPAVTDRASTTSPPEPAVVETSDRRRQPSAPVRDTTIRETPTPTPTPTVVPVKTAPELPNVGAAGALTGPLGRAVTLPSAPPPPAPPPEPAVSTPPVPVPISEPDLRADPSPPPVVDQSAAIRTTLSRYADGYTDLDVAAVTAVWPTVDRAGLKRAFASLDAQQVTLDSCDIRVNGATGRATCAGRSMWVPKIGGKSREQSRTWNFVLKNAGGGWQIVTADVR